MLARHSYVHPSFWYDMTSAESYEKLHPEMVDRLLVDSETPHVLASEMSDEECDHDYG